MFASSIVFGGSPVAWMALPRPISAGYASGTAKAGLVILASRLAASTVGLLDSGAGHFPRPAPRRRCDRCERATRFSRESAPRAATFRDRSRSAGPGSPAAWLLGELQRVLAGAVVIPLEPGLECLRGVEGRYVHQPSMVSPSPAA